MESLDKTDTAVSLMSVDFSKAFNRLSHNACLEKMSEKNASNQSIGMVYAFLEGRQMQVRSGNLLSTLRNVHGGSPQGTKLGNLLFCLSIDDIVHEDPTPVVQPSSPERESAIPREYLPTITSTPAPRDEHETSFDPNPFGMRNKINIIRDSILEESLGEGGAISAGTWEIGYVDDINVGEELDLRDAKLHITTGKMKRCIRATGCENMYRVVDKNGQKIGLQINPAKTQLICFNPGTDDLEAMISIDGKMVKSGNELKILGFYFGSKPNVSCHISKAIKKFNKSLWTIRHLKRAGLKNNVLVKVYCSMLRPLLEYSGNVFISMLTCKQNLMLENCQRKTLKIIFGYDWKYEELLEFSGLVRLDTRREKLFEKFSLKMSKSARFSRKWLPKYDRTDRRELRNKKTFIEFYARTDRLYRSPIFHMRRVLNNLFVL